MKESVGSDTHSSRNAALADRCAPPRLNPDSEELSPVVTRWRTANGDEVPLPGRGDTLGRWRVFAEIARQDVCLAKLLEAHLDALAICVDLEFELPDRDALLGVWAAEAPDAKVHFDTRRGSGFGTLSGAKAWCSGADLVDAALVTAWQGDKRVLALVDLHDTNVRYDDSAWNAVGMGRVRSGRVEFSEAPARIVGLPGAYFQRPGFWHGGAGIAACWFGATTAIADTLRTDEGAAHNPHAQVHLGAIDMALAAAASLLREAATLIDAEPHLSHEHAVRRVRSVTERVAIKVMDRVGRALDPGPLCGNQAHARRCADLTTFVRQSHAERDWAASGESVFAAGQTWTL